MAVAVVILDWKALACADARAREHWFEATARACAMAVATAVAMAWAVVAAWAHAFPEPVGRG